MRLKTAFRLLVCRIKGHEPEQWVFGRGKHRRFKWQCKRCGRRV